MPFIIFLIHFDQPGAAAAAQSADVPDGLGDDLFPFFLRGVGNQYAFYSISMILPPMLPMVDHEPGHPAVDTDVFAGDHRCLVLKTS